MAGKLKKFCFTLNNYTPQEEQEIKEYIEKNAAFAVIGHEVGENNTPHLQGYINSVKQTRFTAIKKVMPRAHLEKANGNDEQNLIYCTKTDKTPYIFGEPQHAGKRNDLDTACKMIQAGSPMNAVAAECPVAYVKYAQGLQRLIERSQTPRDPNNPPVVIWLWGAAGVGKTRFAYDHFPADKIYSKDGTPWWDNYQHQHVILVDDFDGHWPFRDFLKFLDRYPYQGQIKGGYVTINSPVIIITCEYDPSHFWVNNELAQVNRRLTDILHVE